MADSQTNMQDFNALTDPQRRIFLKGVGGVSAALVLATLGGCEQLLEEIEHRPTRRWIGSGSAAVNQDMAIYSDAVNAMKGLASSDARNWNSIAAIHLTILKPN